MTLPRRILHLDIDAFLASVEQIREPALAGRPVVVGSGVVASRSYEAKARGIDTAMVMREARRRCPELVVCDGDARLAERFRQKVAAVLREFAPLVQVCSLDDMYADLTGVATANDPCTFAARIRAAVRAATGLSVSQGIGVTKTVARLATRRAKPGGICVVAPEDAAAFLAAHRLEDLPGIGPRSARLLHELALYRVEELLQVDRELLRDTFGKRGEEIWRRARALDDEPIVPTPQIASISRETSFDLESETITDRELVRAMLAYLLDRAASELRAQGLRARCVQVRVQHVDGVAARISRSLPRPSERTDELGALAGALLEKLLARRVQVRRVGVVLSRLQCPSGQAFLFEGAGLERLFEAIDRIRARHGFGKLVLGQAIGLLGKIPNTAAGFRLRTPSLSR